MRPLSRHLDTRLTEKARALGLMTASLRHYLAAPLAEHCWVAGASDPTLTLVTDGGNWATQLRYQQRELLKRINSEFGLALKRVQVKLMSPVPAALPRARRPPLSAHGARLIAESARTIEDPELRDALLRLLRHRKPQR